MPISVAQFTDLTKNAKVAWDSGRKEFPSVRQMLANIKRVSERTSEYSSISQVSTARRRNEGDDAYKGSLKQGYTKNFTQAEVALEVDVTKQLRMFDKYSEIMDRMRGMGKAAERRMELDLASLLLYAWSTSYTNMDGETVTTSTPDGLALMSTAHTCKGSSNTFSNHLVANTAISTTAIEDMEELANGFLDQADGRNYPIMLNTIITGRHAPTVHTVKRILTSENLQGSADNDKNDFRGSYKHIIVPFMDVLPATEVRSSTYSKYFFLASLSPEDNGFAIEVSQDIQFEAPEQVFESSTWQYLTTALYDFGTTKANFIVGSKGTGVSD